MQNNFYRFLGLAFVTCSLILTACNEATEKPVKKKTRTHLVQTTQIMLESVGLTQIRTGTLTSSREVKIYNQEEADHHERIKAHQGSIAGGVKDDSSETYMKSYDD